MNIKSASFILKILKHGVLSILLLYFIYLMIRITCLYIPMHTDKHFLSIKQTEVQSVAGYLYFFYIHVYTAIWSLLAGAFQFSKTLLNNFKNVHRVLGYIYIISILFCAAPAGLFMGWYANGGWMPQVFFMSLACVWWWTTFQAWRKIVQGDIKAHQSFMIRSYALTLSAITLRLWKLIIVYFFQPAPMDAYVVVSVLSWLPNLIIAEIIIKKFFIKPKNIN